MHSLGYQTSGYIARQWLDLARRQTLAFSQVREDALIDGTIAAMLGTDLDGLMVASGGCTLSYLVSIQRFASLDVVDINESQLALSRLKVHLLANRSTSERMTMLGHQFIPSGHRRNLLINAFYELGLDEKCLGDFELICELGPDNCGRYEMVFAALRANLGAAEPKLLKLLSMDNSMEQSRFLSDNPDLWSAIERAYAFVFSQKNLCEIFGEKATANRVMPFHKHFTERTKVVLETLPARTNPYLTQVFTGRIQGTNNSGWLTANHPFRTPDIAYHAEAMCNYIKYQPDDCYDFVHLSNILDWLSEEEAEQLLYHAYRVLQPHGMVIIRQLNSNLEIRKLNRDIIWLNDLSSKLHKQDRSFFYSKLHVGTK